MTQSVIAQRGQVARKIQEIGSCMELVPMDPNFNNVSVGLYIKEGVLTVWSFSRADGVNDRLRDIRDQMARLGDLAPVEDTDNQLIFPCGMIHERPVKFLLTQAVTRSPDFTHPEGPMTIKDSKSAPHAHHHRRLQATPGTPTASQAKAKSETRPCVCAWWSRDSSATAKWTRSATPKSPSPAASATTDLVRLLLPYSRNISAVESMLEAEATRGQMTTSTLGFSPL